jgi:hypothetical protein
MLEENIEPTDNKRLLLLRYIQNSLGDSSTGPVLLTPEYLYDRYGIDLTTIQSVTAYLEDRELIEIILRPSRRPYATRIKYDDEEDYFQLDIKSTFTPHFRILNDAAEFFGADIATNKLSTAGAREAVLSFIDMIYPAVTVGAIQYKLPGMYNTSPWNIVSFCIDNHQGEHIQLKQLRDEMSKANRPIHGVDRLTTALRRSHFDKKGPLAPFITVSPHAIIVKTVAHLNDEQLNAIKKASENVE